MLIYESTGYSNTLGYDLRQERVIEIEPPEEITGELIGELIAIHKSWLPRYNVMLDAYIGRHPILYQTAKEIYKPDNRIVVNMPKYIVDTFNGFFAGIPIRVSHPDDEVGNYLEFLNQYNNLDDLEAERARLTSIYGHAYELCYVDEQGQIGIVNIDPREAFIVYDNSIRRKPLYGIRYYESDNGIGGSLSDDTNIYYFHQDKDGQYIIDEEDTKPHGFFREPMTEYIENDDRLSIFEPALSLVYALDKAFSEKANDVEYYADAYLKILGAVIDDEGMRKLRDNRIINIASDAEKIIVDFLAKPNADQTQENLINRLEKYIFQVCMAANINDENFGNTSGISLKYKVLSMSNLAAAKERKFTAGMEARYKLIASNPLSHMGENDWMNINYNFTQNVPANLLEETQIASNLQGVVSEETILKELSIVDNIQKEIERKKQEEQERADMFGGYGGFGTSFEDPGV